MESLVAAQNHPPLAQPQQTTIASEGPSFPISVTPITVAQNCMPQGYPWGIPENFMPEGFNLDTQASPVVQAAATLAPPGVHITPATRNEIHYTAPPSVNVMSFVNDEVYRPVPPPSERADLYDRLDDF